MGSSDWSITLLFHCIQPIIFNDKKAVKSKHVILTITNNRIFIYCLRLFIIRKFLEPACCRFSFPFTKPHRNWNWTVKQKIEKDNPIAIMSSLTNFIVKRPLLKRWITPLSQWYTNAAGYRKLGLKYGLFPFPVQCNCNDTKRQK